MNASVINIPAARTPNEVYDVVHVHFVGVVMQTASWDTTDEDQVRTRRCLLAHRDLREYVAFDPPCCSQSKAEWVLSRLARLPVAVVTPDDPIRLWQTLFSLSFQRIRVLVQQCVCCQLPVELPPA